MIIISNSDGSSHILYGSDLWFLDEAFLASICFVIKLSAHGNKKEMLFLESFQYRMILEFIHI